MFREFSETTLVGREAKTENTVVDISGVLVGGLDIVVMPGRCSVESEEQLLATAVAVKRAGAKTLRGRALKPRTSPYSFHGLHEAGLRPCNEIVVCPRAASDCAVPVYNDVRITAQTL